MKLIGLDLATATGVAIGDTSDRPSCHTEKMGPPSSPHGLRLAQCLQMTLRLIKQHEPDLIAIESPVISGAVGGAERALLAIGYRGAVLAACHIKGVEVVEYPVQTIRKHFIGVGNMKRKPAKENTIARCKKLGWHVQNDNEADAAAVWDLARDKFSNNATMPPNGLFDEPIIPSRRRTRRPS